MIRIAHLSDLHFHHPTYNPLQFLSKRWVGNLNMLLFSRRGAFCQELLATLVEEWKKEKITHVIITGDFTTTAEEKEFEKASAFVDTIKEAGFLVYCLPGNHDNYTKRSQRKKTFYNYFGGTSPIQVLSLTDTWTLLLLDTAPATSLFSSQGIFSSACEEELENVLRELPKEKRVILANHFPFFHHVPPNNILVRGEYLRALLERYNSVSLYLHGHTHRQTLADLQEVGLPIIADAGSIAHKPKGRSYNSFALDEKRCITKQHRYDEKRGAWHIACEKTSYWKNHEMV